MVRLFAAVIVPPPAKPPVSVILPDVDSIFAFVPVMRAALAVMVMSPAALRSSPWPVVMKPLAAWPRVIEPPVELMTIAPEVLTLPLTVMLPVASRFVETAVPEMAPVMIVPPVVLTVRDDEPLKAGTEILPVEVTLADVLADNVVNFRSPILVKVMEPSPEVRLISGTGATEEDTTSTLALEAMAMDPSADKLNAFADVAGKAFVLPRVKPSTGSVTETEPTRGRLSVDKLELLKVTLPPVKAGLKVVIVAGPVTVKRPLVCVTAPLAVDPELLILRLPATLVAKLGAATVAVILVPCTVVFPAAVVVM